MPEAFAEDPKLQRITEAYALDAIDFAQDRFQLSLDWSGASVAHIETMLVEFRRQIASVKPTDEQIARFAKLFGSYVGEVFRRNHANAAGSILAEQSFKQRSRALGGCRKFRRSPTRCSCNSCPSSREVIGRYSCDLSLRHGATPMHQDETSCGNRSTWLRPALLQSTNHVTK